MVLVGFGLGLELRMRFVSVLAVARRSVELSRPRSNQWPKREKKKKSQQLVVGMASLMLGWRLRIGGFGEEPGRRNEGQQHTAPRGLLATGRLRAH